jgi:hypothetical protein
VVRAGAQMRAECAPGSRTQQISRKRRYKTLDLQRRKSHMAMTTPRRPFCVITRKEIARSAKSLGTPRICWHANARGFSKSFGGRLVQIRAIQAWNSTRRAWSSVEEFDWSRESQLSEAPLQAQSDKCALSPRAYFSRAGFCAVVSVRQYGNCLSLKSLLHLTGL